MGRLNLRRVAGGFQIGVYLWIACYAALIAPTLNNTRPYVGDESFYMVSSIGMVHTGDVLVPVYFGKIRLQKPILPYWITAAGHRAFGVHLWSGRVGFLLLACALLILVYRLALLLLEDHDCASLAVLLLSSTTLFVVHSRISVTDLPLTFFTLLGLHACCRAVRGPARLGRWHIVACAAMGLAFSSKGFVGATPALAIAAYLIATRPAHWPRALAVLAHPVCLALFALLAFSWYGYVHWRLPGELWRQFEIESQVNLGTGIWRMPGHLVYYAGASLGYFLPGAVLLGMVIAAKRRFTLPQGLRPVLWHLAVTGVLLVCVVRRRDSRYLLVVMPGLALLAATLARQRGLDRVARNVAITWAALQVAFFLAFPVATGEPLRALVRQWAGQGEGALASYEMPERDRGWLLALTEGRLRPYGPGCRHVILEDRQLLRFQERETARFRVVGEARRTRGVTLRWPRPVPRYRKYFLLEILPTRPGAASPRAFTPTGQELPSPR